MFKLLSQRPGWPSQCLICRAWPAATVCRDCAARFIPAVPRCATCALPVPPGVAQCGACLSAPPPFERCLAALPYQWPWTHCLAQFKFHHDPGLAGPLARLLADAPGVAPALAAADALVPIPLSAQRLAERGYNPAQLLAGRLAPGRLRNGLLLRIRHTGPQHALPRAERLHNVRGAFAVEPRAAAALRGQAVILLDDVMTTGATLSAAALALRAAGAARVTALALARTGPP